MVNVAGIKPGDLKLNGQVLGDTYLGKITKWNDPPRRPGTPIWHCWMPTRIAVVRQSRRFGHHLASPTTFKVNRSGRRRSVKAPRSMAHGAGGKGNEGRRPRAGRPSNSIGCRVRLCEAKQDDLRDHAE